MFIPREKIMRVDRLRWIKKLEARVKYLTTKFEKSKKVYERAEEDWRRDLEEWVVTNIETCISNLKSTDIAIRSGNRHRYNQGHWTSAFFENAPPAPQYPRRNMIDSLQSKIRFWKQLNCPKVDVSEHDVDNWFDDDTEADG